MNVPFAVLPVLNTEPAALAVVAEIVVLDDPENDVTAPSAFASVAAIAVLGTGLDDKLPTAFAVVAEIAVVAPPPPPLREAGRPSGRSPTGLRPTDILGCSQSDHREIATGIIGC